MTIQYLEARQKVVTFARKLQAERLVYSTAGNISLRIPEAPHLLAVTPASTQYDFLGPEDIVVVDLDGQVVDGHRSPTSETQMHALISKRRPEIGAIVHTHGKAVMTMANLGWNLPPILTGLVEAAGGTVYCSPYSQPETEQMADFTEEALKDRGATFLRFHGALSIGADLEHAFHTAAVVEGACEVYLTGKQMGVDVPELPQADVEWIASYFRAQFAGAPEPLPAPTAGPYPGLSR